MKRLPKIKISDELNQQIDTIIKQSRLSKSNVVEQALQIGLPQLSGRFKSISVRLEGQIRKALVESAQYTTRIQFAKRMKALDRASRIHMKSHIGDIYE